MQKFFDPESGPMRFLSAVFDFALINLFTLLLSLPLVTAGAAFAALFKVMNDSVHRDTPLRLAALWQQFKLVLARVTPAWLLSLAAALLLAIDLSYVSLFPAGLRLIVYAGSFFLLFSLALTLIKVLALAGENPEFKLRELIQLSALSAIATLPQMVLALIFFLLPAAILLMAPLWFLGLTMIWLFFWPVLPIFIAVKLKIGRDQIVL